MFSYPSFSERSQIYCRMEFFSAIKLTFSGCGWFLFTISLLLPLTGPQYHLKNIRCCEFFPNFRISKRIFVFSSNLNFIFPFFIHVPSCFFRKKFHRTPDVSNGWFVQFPNDWIILSEYSFQFWWFQSQSRFGFFRYQFHPFFGVVWWLQFTLNKVTNSDFIMFFWFYRRVLVLLSVLQQGCRPAKRVSENVASVQNSNGKSPACQQTIQSFIDSRIQSKHYWF